MAGTIEIKQTERFATVTFSNPGKLNAIDYVMWQQLRDAMNRLSQDEDLRCIILRGAGDRAFAAGGDIEEFVTHRATLEQAQHYHGEIVAQALQAVDRCLHPTIAMIYGACIGGGLEIAAQCDLRICAQSARFGAPINRLGFSMYPEELISLLHMVTPAVALEILLEGRIYDAREAYERGIIHRVLADDQVEHEVQICAQRIADGAPLVARTHKQLIRRLARNPAPLSAQETAACFAFLDTEDYRIGLDAFLAKTKPRFTGR